MPLGKRWGGHRRTAPQRTTTAASATSGWSVSVLYLAGFDAEATDLDLVVGSTDELQLAVLVPPHQVTRCGTYACRLSRVGIRHEPLGRQAGPAQTSPGRRQPPRRTAPHHAGCHQLQSRTEHVRPQVGDTDADDAGRRRALLAPGSGG